MGKYGDIILDKMSFGWTGYMLTTMLDSALMRSMAVGDLAAWPWEDLAPLIAWMAERRRENVKRHLSQHRVLLYGKSHFWASMDDRCL